MTEVSSDDLFQRYAYTVSKKTRDLGRSDTRLFFAERYGGQGILSHGGGVRCGSDGIWQAKGMGRNLLAGADVPVSDSNGCFHLHDAVREAIWGELFHHALPYGGARVGAVIATGETQDYGNGVRVRTGLAVRQAVVRPGNFMRSIYFRPSEEMKQISAPSDSERVRAAINVLPDVLERPPHCSESDWSSMSRLDRLHLGLDEMMRRFARQTAAAQARRIMHGAITASNVGLDGRWIDYGTVSTLPGYGSVKHVQMFWADAMHYQRIAEDLCFYIDKYFLHGNGDRLPTLPKLIHSFAQSHAVHSRTYFCLLTGIPEDVLARIQHEDAVSCLTRHLIALATACAYTTCAEYPESEIAFGSRNLGPALVGLATHAHDAACDSHLASLVPDSTARHGLISAYRGFHACSMAEARSSGIEESSMRRLMIINSTKAAHTVALFLRKELVRETERIDAECEDLDDYRTHAQALFDSLSNQAAFVYRESSDWATSLWQDSSLRVEYDARTDRLLAHNNGRTDSFELRSITSDHSTPPQLRAMKGYWGKQLWNAVL